MPYHVTCESCGLLLYSAAPIRERVCQRCGAELPEPEPGSPPVSEVEADEDRAPVGGDPAVDAALRSPFRDRRIESS